VPTATRALSGFSLVILIEQVPQLVGLPTDVFPTRPGFEISVVLVPSGKARVLIVAAAEHAPISDHLSDQNLTRAAINDFGAKAVAGVALSPMRLDMGGASSKRSGPTAISASWPGMR
jgi:hypothetical protein